MRGQPINPRRSVFRGRTLDRRQVLRGGLALGLGFPAVAALLRTAAAQGAQDPTGVDAQ